MRFRIVSQLDWETIFLCICSSKVKAVECLGTRLSYEICNHVDTHGLRKKNLC